MKKMFKTTISILILGAFSNINIAQAQDNNSGGQVGTQIATSIVLPPNYSDSQLKGAGCDKQIWTKMVADYTAKAKSNIEIGQQIQVANQISGAPNPAANCYDAAANIINNATRAYNAIASILSGGGMDSGQLLEYAKKIAVGAACSQVNSYINQSGVGTAIGTVNSGIGTVLNTGTNVGGVNTGSVGTVLNNGGFTQDTGNNIPAVNSNDMANQVSTSVTNTGVSNTIGNINPFK